MRRALKQFHPAFAVDVHASPKFRMGPAAALRFAAREIPGIPGCEGA